MPLNRAPSLIAAVLVGGLALSACSAGEAPTARPSVVRPTPAASVGASAGTGTSNELTAARAAVPKAARTHTRAGAQAFAEFYFGRVNAAWTRADPTLLTPYATKDCKSCANYEAEAEKLKSQSQRFASNPMTILSAAWLPESRENWVVVSVSMKHNAFKVIDAQGKVVDQESEAPALQEVEVVWRSGSWLVDKVYFVDVQK